MRALAQEHGESRLKKERELGEARLREKELRAQVQNAILI